MDAMMGEQSNLAHAALEVVWQHWLLPKKFVWMSILEQRLPRLRDEIVRSKLRRLLAKEKLKEESSSKSRSRSSQPPSSSSSKSSTPGSAPSSSAASNMSALKGLENRLKQEVGYIEEEELTSFEVELNELKVIELLLEEAPRTLQDSIEEGIRQGKMRGSGMMTFSTNDLLGALNRLITRYFVPISNMLQHQVISFLVKMYSVDYVTIENSIIRCFQHLREEQPHLVTKPSLVIYQMHAYQTLKERLELVELSLLILTLIPIHLETYCSIMIDREKCFSQVCNKGSPLANCSLPKDLTDTVALSAKSLTAPLCVDFLAKYHKQCIHLLFASRSPIPGERLSPQEIKRRQGTVWIGGVTAEFRMRLLMLNGLFHEFHSPHFQLSSSNTSDEESIASLMHNTIECDVATSLCKLIQGIKFFCREPFIETSHDVITNVAPEISKCLFEEKQPLPLAWRTLLLGFKEVARDAVFHGVFNCLSLKQDQEILSLVVSSKKMNHFSEALYWQHFEEQTSSRNVSSVVFSKGKEGAIEELLMYNGQTIANRLAFMKMGLHLPLALPRASSILVSLHHKELHTAHQFVSTAFEDFTNAIIAENYNACNNPLWKMDADQLIEFMFRRDSCIFMKEAMDCRRRVYESCVNKIVQDFYSSSVRGEELSIIDDLNKVLLLTKPVAVYLVIPYGSVFPWMSFQQDSIAGKLAKQHVLYSCYFQVMSLIHVDGNEPSIQSMKQAGASGKESMKLISELVNQKKLLQNQVLGKLVKEMKESIEAWSQVKAYKKDDAEVIISNSDQCRCELYAESVAMHVLTLCICGHITNDTLGVQRTFSNLQASRTPQSLLWSCYDRWCSSFHYALSRARQLDESPSWTTLSIVDKGMLLHRQTARMQLKVVGIEGYLKRLETKCNDLQRKDVRVKGYQMQTKLFKELIADVEESISMILKWTKLSNLSHSLLSYIELTLTKVEGDATFGASNDGLEAVDLINKEEEEEYINLDLLSVFLFRLETNLDIVFLQTQCLVKIITIMPFQKPITEQSISIDIEGLTWLRDELFPSLLLLIGNEADPLSLWYHYIENVFHTSIHVYGTLSLAIDWLLSPLSSTSPFYTHSIEHLHEFDSDRIEVRKKLQDAATRWETRFVESHLRHEKLHNPRTPFSDMKLDDNTMILYHLLGLVE